jgi:hypothetical protein
MSRYVEASKVGWLELLYMFTSAEYILNVFISWCLLYQLLRVFQTKVYKIGGCYSVRMTKKWKVGSLQKISE